MIEANRNSRKYTELFSKSNDNCSKWCGKWSGNILQIKQVSKQVIVLNDVVSDPVKYNR